MSTPINQVGFPPKGVSGNYYATATGSSVTYTIAANNFNPPLPTNTIPLLEIYCIQWQTSAPGGGASEAGWTINPSTPFNGQTVITGFVYKNVAIGDKFTLQMVFNGAGGVVGNWCLKAIY